jgi:alkylation response protein AidB-like acyl-CoA dehydrogenase
MLKIRATELLQHMTELALELQGPYAAAHDPADLVRPTSEAETPARQASALAHQYLYGRCWSIFGGTNEIQRNIIAKAILAS